ncbi:YcaO-like family protein [Nocardia inohanensis]|uniref:YcaO-like family protein n=1 Tax=Nocardia inohanensis TaxID=209246 RepID=UPI00083327D8|nr:YcaO-like family protein [Nocardia inohanensis]
MTGPLVDPRTGIVRRVTPVQLPATFPPGFRMFDSVLSDTTRFAAWPVDSSGGGCAFHDEDAARAAAIGEAVERYCGNLVPDELIRGRGIDLRAAGHRVLPLAEVALYSQTQYATVGFPFVPLTDELEIDWTRGHDLLTGAAVLVPAGLVWVSYPLAVAESTLPVTNPIIQAGLSAGPDMEFATFGALCEIIERDAMALAWHTRDELVELTPEPSLARLATRADSGITTRFFLFPNEFGLYVVGALTHDPNRGYLTMGAAARPSATAAARKALLEALQLQRFVAEYDDPDGPYMRAALDPRSPLQPWRRDRGYRDGYGEELDRLVDYGCHLQLFLDPAVQREFRAELEISSTSEIPLSVLPDATELTDARALAARIAETGAQVAVVDVTTEDVAPTGMRAVRVIATGLYSNSAAGMPFLGGRRLAEALTARGTTRRVLPLPH